MPEMSGPLILHARQTLPCVPASLPLMPYNTLTLTPPLPDGKHRAVQGQDDALEEGQPERHVAGILLSSVGMERNVDHPHPPHSSDTSRT